MIGAGKVLERHNILGSDGGQGGVTVEGVRERNIFVQGEGVRGNRAWNMENYKEHRFLPAIGGVELEKVLRFGGDEVYVEGLGSITGSIKNNFKLCGV